MIYSASDLGTLPQYTDLLLSDDGRSIYSGKDEDLGALNKLEVWSEPQLSKDFEDEL